MMGKTHMIGGLTLAVAVSSAISYQTNSIVAYGIYLGSATLGALIPDIDKKGSTISGKNLETKTISFITRLFFSHRGFTHSLLFMLIVGIMSFIGTRFVPYSNDIFLGLMLGIGSHLLLDSLTVEGEDLFFPLPKKIRFLKLRTGGICEKLLSLAMLIYLGTSLAEYVVSTSIGKQAILLVQSSIENLLA